MDSTIKKFIVLLIVFVVSALIVGRVFSYNDTVSHPSFTEDIAQVYNANFDNKLSDEEINWLKQGSIEEDIPIRWMNHFYEPSTNKGIWGFSSSKDWAQNPTLQSSYVGMKGDQSWQKAIDSYVKGDNKSAFVALGHVLHLVEDATVPAHTRLDAHPEGDPYEKWVKDAIQNNINFSVQPATVDNLSDAFYKVAFYSNKYFLSKDTVIFDQNDAVENIVNKKLYLFAKDDSGNRFKLLEKKIISGETFYNFDDLVNSDYFNLLGPKAVSYGAGVIKLFFDEAEKKKQEQEQKNWWDKTKNWFDVRTNLFSDSLLSLFPGSGSDIAETSPTLPEGLTINQAAIDQLSGANQTNQPNNQVNNNQEEENRPDEAGIVNLTPQNFPQPINIVPKMPMVLGETTVNGNEKGDEKQTAGTADAETQSPSVSNPTVPIGGGASQPAAAETFQEEQQAELPAASSTPEETASTTEDLIPPETYATSTPVINGQTIATSTIIFEFSASEATSTFQCRLDNASSTICVSPMEYQNLTNGEHEFEVEAIDAAGNADPTPVIFDWTIDATAPEISLNLVNYQLTSINFAVAWTASSSDVASYEIQYKIGEDGAWPASNASRSDAGWQDWAISATSSQKNFQANQDGTTYYFRGRAKDNLGNQSAWQEILAEISQYPVVINEIAWMGTAAKYSSDEWIELYNKSDQEINLSGWTLRAIDGAPNITLATTVPAHGFYLLERTNDDTISDIKADQTYTGVLAGGSAGGIEVLELRNQNGQLIDATPPADHCPGYNWIAGQVSGYKTMERINPYRDGANIQNWGTNNGIIINGLAADGATPVHGTPKAQNSRYDSELESPTIIFSATVIDLDTIWPLGRSPYILESSGRLYPTLAAGATLIIEPGVIIKPNSILIIKGALLAQGTSEKPILFTSNQPTPQPGDWASIVFKPESVGSVLANAIFEYGGREFSGYSYVDYSMVFVDQSSVTIKDCQFQKGGWIALKLNNSSALIENSIFAENVKGIVIDGAASHPIIKDSEFRGASHQGTGIEISNGAAPVISSNNFSNLNYPILLKNASPVFSENSVSNNNYNGVYVHWQTTFTQDVVWQNDLTYILMSNAGDYPTIASGTVLTIEPGTIIKPANRFYTAMVVKGRLVAEGTADQPIIFTSFKDDSVGGDTNNDGSATAPGTDGDWKDIVFSAGSSGSLDNIHFKYGGYIPGWMPGYDPYKTLNIDPAASGNVVLGGGVVVE